jgi:hypothetical protein
MLFICGVRQAWLTVRDVISVDGKPVPRRLPTLLASPDVWIRDLRALSQENGRYNIGRSIATSTNRRWLPFLDSATGADSVHGRWTRRNRREPPEENPVRRGRDADGDSEREPEPSASGSLIVEPATGRVLRTELACS